MKLSSCLNVVPCILEKFFKKFKYIFILQNNSYLIQLPQITPQTSLPATKNSSYNLSSHLFCTFATH